MLFPQCAQQLRWVYPHQRWWLAHPIWKRQLPLVYPLMENPLAPSGVCGCLCCWPQISLYWFISVSWTWLLVDDKRWETRVPGEVTTREYKNSDGTFTVQSDYILVPSRETHKETLTCVTTYNEEVFTDSVTLDIQCKPFSRKRLKVQNKQTKWAEFQAKFLWFVCVPDEPDVSVDGFDGNWYLNRENVQLSCQADANPAVSLYQWRLWVELCLHVFDLKDHVH